MNISEFNEIIEQNDQTDARRAHLEALRELVGNVYPNKFERSNITGAEDTISNVLSFEPVAAVAKEIKEHISTLGEGEKPAPELKEQLNAKLKEFGNVRVSGRLTTTPRTMGKAAFVHLSDGVNRLQIYVRRDDIKGVSNDGKNSEVNGWDLFKLLDGGDFVGVGGFLFLTNTGELSVHVETIQFLSKALLPMPDKMHGIADPELQRRFRYADLIASSLQIEHEGLTTREVFERRAKLISGMRRFLDDNDFIEVETPMLTPKATGAAAEPFETFHKALGITLYARIAPELYLKRLTVGGFEKVYELNRNFRNEGLSQKHNPEFTMLEFYCAYMDVNGMMDFAEAMIKESVQKATGGSLLIKIDELDEPINFESFARLTMKDAITKHWFKGEQNSKQLMKVNCWEMSRGRFNRDWLDNPNYVRYLAAFIDPSTESPFFVPNTITSIGVDADFSKEAEKITKNFIENKLGEDVNNPIDETTGKLIVELFEQVVEAQLIQPTFIIDYPKSISPLSKASPENPNIAERFELFINGMECANGFSELNDPQEQYERFRDQMRERETGDHEAMVMDEDYIRALAYGMPPAAGIGIGIDRLVMLLTNKHSIRDVILFPHMRPEQKQQDASEAEESDAQI